MDCPNCATPMQHYLEPYAFGGIVDTYACEQCNLIIQVLPTPSDHTSDFTALNAPGRRTGKWTPFYEEQAG